MDAQHSPKVFVSYQHADKRVARRVAAMLAAHGVQVWLDEREMRFGSALTQTIRTHIAQTDLLLVIASQASASAPWVGEEIAHAKSLGKSIAPILIEPVADHERFRDHLGVKIASPQDFAGSLHRVAADLFRSFDLDLPPADPRKVEARLRELAKQEPNIAPLVLGCLEGEGLHGENMETAFQVQFHVLDEAVNSLYELRQDRQSAIHAATAFRKAGAGMWALSKWIAKAGDAVELASAVGGPLAPSLLDAAITLLGACDPPDDHALYMFIDRNADQLSQEQRSAAIGLATWPVRKQPECFADDLAYVALKAFPEADGLRLIWIRWIRNGAFDGKPRSPADLARDLARAQAEGLPGWAPVHEALQGHVRGLLRSGDRDKVDAGLQHLMDAAETGAPVYDALRTEADHATGSAEWEDWEKRDRDTAKWCNLWVRATLEEARGEHNWLRALQSANTHFANIKRLERLRDQTP